jgi:hypothetical protein
MPSKPIVRKQRLGDALRTSMTQHKGALLEGLRDRFGDLLEDGEVEASYERMHQFFLDLLSAREQALVAADEAHLAEKMDDRGPRRRRDQAAEDVASVLVAIRRAANGHFGTEQAAELLNLEGETSHDPVIAHRQGNRVMERLRDASLQLPESLLSGEAPDREGWAARLEPPLTALRQALDEVGEEERQASLTQGAKEIAVDDFDNDTRALSRILEGYLLLGARKDLSEDVRPGRLNRRARTRAEPEGEGEPTPEEPPTGEDLPTSTPPTAEELDGSPNRPDTGS